MEKIIQQVATIIAERVAEILHQKEEHGKKEQTTKPEPSVSYTIKDICERLKLSKATLQRHKKDGKLKASFYVGCSPRFTEEDIQNYLLMFKSGKE